MLLNWHSELTEVTSVMYGFTDALRGGMGIQPYSAAMARVHLSSVAH